MSECDAGVGLSASMVVLAQARREGGDISMLQTGVELGLKQDRSCGPRALVLPACVPEDELAAMTVCMHAVASGEHTGLEFAEILQRAEIRCEIAYDVDQLELPIVQAIDVYRTAILEVDKRFGWLTNFVGDVADLAVVLGVTSRISGLGRVDELDHTVRLALNLKIVGQNVVVATPAMGSQASHVKQMHDDYRVVPISIYRALMKVTAKVIGSAVCVSVSRSVDGVYRLENDFDCSSCYSVASLPLGRYALPGGYGRLVSGDFLRGVLESVVALPALKATDGFCYVDTLPPSMRLRAAVLLGRDPSVMNLTNFFPEAYDWCAEEAVVKKIGYSGDHGNYHVVSAGTLPGHLPRMARVGMADRYASDLSVHTDKLLNDIFNVAGNSIESTNAHHVPGLQQRMRQQGDTMHASQVAHGSSQGFAVPRAMRADLKAIADESPGRSGLVPPNHVRSVSDSCLTLSNRVVLDMGKSIALRPVWEDVDNPRARMWTTRLGEGAPIDPKRLLELTKTKISEELPVPPASVSGTSIMIRSANAMRSEGGKLITWDRKAIIIPGCTMEYSKLASNKGKRFIAVHPARGVICRYDMHFDRTVVVNGSLSIPSVDCVIWLHGDVSFNIMGSGSVVRTWFDDGMPGLGSMVTSMVFSFAASAVRRYGGEIQADRVIGLELKSVDPNAGLVRFHKRFRMKPNVEKVHLYAFDEVIAEPVLLVVQAPGLRYMVVHGTRIPADSCQASVVVLDAQTTVKLCVEATSESTTVDAQMVFVRESRRYAAHVGHDVTKTAKVSQTKAPLFIEN